MYPLNLNLKHRPVLVVGGGKVAERKVLGLLDAEADRVRVISPELTPALRELAASGRIEWHARRFAPKDATGVFLLFAATDSPEAQRLARDAARKTGALLNIADAPEDCDFQVPAVVRRDTVLVTVATSGGSPALAAAIKAELAERIGPEYAVLARLVARLRAKTLEMPLSPAEKKALFRQIPTADMARWLRDGQNDRARARLEAIFGSLFPIGPLEDLIAPIRTDKEARP